MRWRQGLVACLLAICVATVASAAASSRVQFTCGAPNCPITINDNPNLIAFDAAATPYPSEIHFSHGDPCCPKIEKVTVTLTGLTHASFDNLDVLLVRESPGRPTQVVELLSDAGGPFPVADLELTFDDAAASAVPAGAPPVRGSYKPSNYAGTLVPCAPDQPPSARAGDPFPAPAPARTPGGYGETLGVFAGTPLSGETWHLYVADDCIGGGGSIASWRLDITLEQDGPLFLSKWADAPSVSAGSPIGFAIDVVNVGQNVAFSVGVDDPLPPGPGIDWSVSPPNGSCAVNGSPPDQKLMCDFGALPPYAGAGVHVSSPTTAKSCGTYSNTATVSSDNYPLDESSATVAVVDCPTSVQVSGLTATPTARGALLRWRAFGARLLGFEIFRDGRRATPRLLPPGARQWLDRAGPRSGPVRYRLDAVAIDGSRSSARTTSRRSGTR